MKIYTAALIFTVLFAMAAPHPTLASHHGSHVVVPPGQTAPRVGPSYLYPDPETTPGVINPEVTQANIQQTICMKGWEHDSATSLLHELAEEAATARRSLRRQESCSLRRRSLHVA
jgi:hypothetical protein